MTLFRFFLTLGRADNLVCMVCHKGRVEIATESWAELMDWVNHSTSRDSVVFRWHVTSVLPLGRVKVIAYV